MGLAEGGRAGGAACSVQAPGLRCGGGVPEAWRIDLWWGVGCVDLRRPSGVGIPGLKGRDWFLEPVGGNRCCCSAERPSGIDLSIYKYRGFSLKKNSGTFPRSPKHCKWSLFCEVRGDTSAFAAMFFLVTLASFPPATARVEKSLLRVMMRASCIRSISTIRAKPDIYMPRRSVGRRPRKKASAVTAERSVVAGGWA